MPRTAEPLRVFVPSIPGSLNGRGATTGNLMTADEMEMTDNDGDQRITVLFLTIFHDAREVVLSISSAFPV